MIIIIHLFFLERLEAVIIQLFFSMKLPPSRTWQGILIEKRRNLGIVLYKLEAKTVIYSKLLFRINKIVLFIVVLDFR